LGQISKLEIVDIGGSGRGIDQVSSIVPNVLFKFLLAAKAQGIDFTALLEKLGIDPAKAMAIISGLSSTSEPAKTAPVSPEGKPSAEPLP